MKPPNPHPCVYCGSPAFVERERDGEKILIYREYYLYGNCQGILDGWERKSDE